MIDANVAGIVFGTLAIALLIGIPIGYSLGIATTIGLLSTPIPLIYIAQTFYTGTGLFPLIAIPGFILAGELMVRSQLTERIIRIMYALTGNIPGGLAVVTILSCAFFASLSGSGPATTASIGSIMVPAMVRAGYPVPWAAAVAASGGTLGILIPPSNPMIIYGVSANLSISGLFFSGILPGLLLVLVLSTYCWVMGKMHGMRSTGQRFGWQALGAAAWDGRAALVMPVLVLGVIYAGVATPTEAAMFAVIYAGSIGFFTARMRLADVARAMVTTGRLTGAVLIVMGPAMAFGKLLTMYQIPNQIAEMFLAISKDPVTILFLIAVLLVIVGCFMETLSTIVLLTPVLLPPLLKMGVDPVHFGILFVVLCEVGMLTPPLGVNLFVASAISKTSIEQISKAVFPFVIVLFMYVSVLIFFPDVATWGYRYIAVR